VRDAAESPAAEPAVDRRNTRDGIRSRRLGGNGPGLAGPSDFRRQLRLSGAATTTFSVDPEEELTYVIAAQLMPNDSALMQRVETLIYQAIAD
jgi:hypothetical protein